MGVADFRCTSMSHEPHPRLGAFMNGAGAGGRRSGGEGRAGSAERGRAERPRTTPCLCSGLGIFFGGTRNASRPGSRTIAPIASRPGSRTITPTASRPGSRTIAPCADDSASRPAGHSWLRGVHGAGGTDRENVSECREARWTELGRRPSDLAVQKANDNSSVLFSCHISLHIAHRTMPLVFFRDALIPISVSATDG